jgi:hypothetical protein
VASLQSADGILCQRQLTRSRVLARFQQLVGHVAESAYHHHGPLRQPLLHNLHGASNGGGILERRAAKFHHNARPCGFGSLGGSFSDWLRHFRLSCKQKTSAVKTKPTDRSLSLLVVGLATF